MDKTLDKDFAAFMAVFAPTMVRTFDPTRGIYVWVLPKTSDSK